MGREESVDFCFFEKRDALLEGGHVPVPMKCQRLHTHTHPTNVLSRRLKFLGAGSLNCAVVGQIEVSLIQTFDLQVAGGLCERETCSSILQSGLSLSRQQQQQSPRGSVLLFLVSVQFRKANSYQPFQNCLLYAFARKKKDRHFQQKRKKKYAVCVCARIVYIK